MLSADFVKKLRRIEIRTRRIVNTTFAGEYRSTFKGTGLEFVDVREYLPGDDVRSIDWRVTARMGRPYVRKFVEERELTVILCVDASGSAHFGTRGRFKLEQAAQAAATLAFSAVRNNDKVGLLFFTDRPEKFVPPRKGRMHVMRLIRDILAFEPASRGTGPGAALEFLMRLLKRRAVVIFISDFAGPGFSPDRFEVPLGVAARRHDLVAVAVRDRAELELPAAGLADLEDLETGEIITVDTSDRRLREGYQRHQALQRARTERLLKTRGVDLVSVTGDEDFVPKLHRFFRMRARRAH
ncbi:MAG TPA: DUF58 domain-containing protein [candidate division Zixibacteria bacterium]|jgi:uncharacterized protein (DUF58 family)|nr:DUF58 domain-containing protein [candidate division Zixibacteria bacterium]